MAADGMMLEALGGETGCRQLAHDFYGRVAGSEDLKPLFPGKSLRCAEEELAAFLVQFLGGDEDRTQYRWWLSLRESHSRFRISENQRMSWLRLMREALDSHLGDDKDRVALHQFFSAVSVYLVRVGEADILDSELKRRWAAQRDLDRLVEHLANEQDTEAITLAERFVDRPAVLVAILARMLITGRPTLVDFVVRCIRKTPKSRTSRSNGRTLLHFACSHACLPVVRELLSFGVDPNVMDAGDHAPLYRVAGARSKDAVEIALSLLEAGASIDHCGGVSRSTALHEAARHGNLPVATMLVKAGANLVLRDRKGMTPFDRAVRCRRHEVAEMLAGRV